MTPSNINPGADTTINPVVIDDSKREKQQQPDIVDEMMGEYSCIFYPMCYKARELLYCPQKVGKVKCDDYRQYLTPALIAYYTERSRDTGKSISSLVLQDLDYIEMIEREVIALLQAGDKE